MADQLKTDILMKFIRNGQSINGECAAQKDPLDDFMTEFNPSSDAEDYSDFFQVEKFDFGYQVKDSDSSTGKASKQAAAAMTKVGTKGAETSKGGISFKAWRTSTDDELQQNNDTTQYQCSSDEFNFTRQVDAGSPIFFEGCCRNWTFDKAILVKRASIDDKRMPMAFLQITFDKVLFTGVSWDDGDVLNETCKFICQTMTIKYKQQNEDGVLTPTGQVVWDWTTNSKRDTTGS